MSVLVLGVTLTRLRGTVPVRPLTVIVNVPVIIVITRVAMVGTRPVVRCAQNVQRTRLLDGRDAVDVGRAVVPGPSTSGAYPREWGLVAPRT